MTKKQKKMLCRILLTAALLIGLHFVPAQGWLRFGLYMVPYLLIGYDILRRAVHGITHKQVFDENFLMAVATIGAIVVAVTGDGDYVEAIGVQRTDGHPPGLCKRSAEWRACTRGSGRG